MNPACTEIIQPDACRIVFRFKDIGFPWSNEAVEQVQAAEEKKVKQLVSKLSEPGLTFLDGARVVRMASTQAHGSVSA